MSAVMRWWLRRRHGRGPWRGLLDPHPGDEQVSLDLETTGLDPRHDRIVALAAVPIRDGRIRLSERYTRLVNPGRSFGIDSIRHHRLRPSDLIDAPRLETLLPDFLTWLGNRPLLGYCIRFDLAMLAGPTRALTGFTLVNRRIDIGFEYAARQRRRHPETEPRLDLDSIARALDVPILERHSALGDALTVAMCWLALQADRTGSNQTGRLR